MPEKHQHYHSVINALKKGRVVPFLGAGVNLCGRPDGTAWKYDNPDYLPSGHEMAKYLAREYKYPSNDKLNLLRVSQYVAIMVGTGPLYEDIHDLFDKDFPPTPVHRFLVNLPREFREKGYPPRYQLIVTTNYDDVLERAFTAVEEPFDLVSYVAEGNNRGKFIHWTPDGETFVIERPNEYRGLSLEKRTVILKIHGAVNRARPENDSYVITEDHYIDYLTRTDISNLIPVTLAAKLRRSHFLFLGYSLSDWNLRVIIHRIWGEQPLTYNSWAIQLNPDKLEQRFWEKRGESIEIMNVPLEDYISELISRIRALPRLENA